MKQTPKNREKCHVLRHPFYPFQYPQGPTFVHLELSHARKEISHDSSNALITPAPLPLSIDVIDEAILFKLYTNNVLAR